MKQINLQGYDESVKRFVLAASGEPGGALLEIDGRVVARVLPVLPHAELSPNGAWTDEKNKRRCELVDKKIAGTMLSEEGEELARLQREMLDYRRRVAPLPLDDARRLHQQLLALAQAQQGE